MKWPQELRLSRLARHTMVRNVISLYGAQIASYILPLVLIPYLARVLGASGWGLVAFAQGFGAYLVVVVEFGFFLSANREVARNREDREKLGEILAGVLGARGVLAAACLAVALMARHWVPAFREHPDLLWAGVFWGLSQGFNLNWLFQGLERMKLVAAIEIPPKILATIAIFLFVRRPQDGWLVLMFLGSGYATSVIIALALAYRELPFHLPTWNSTRKAFRMAGGMFLLKGSLALYTSGNAFILGLFVSPRLVGYFTAAEKISRASVRLLTPVTQTFYPRVSYLVLHARAEAQRLARIGVIVTGASGLLLAMLVFLAAPWLVRIIAGPGFGPAVPLLRILALLPILIAISHAYGEQWMLPLGLERSVTLVVLLAGGVNLALAVILVPRFAAFGMACAAVSAEAVVAFGLFMMLRLHGRDPLHPSVGTEGGAG